MLIGENCILPKVGQSTSLLDEGGGKTVSIGDVVDQLRVHVVPQLEEMLGKLDTN